MNRLAEGVLGGWLLSGLGTWQSGLPLTVAANSGTTPSGATANRADRVGSGSLDTPTPQQWLDVTAYELPPYIDVSQARPVRQFGTTGVGTVYGPRLFSFDMTMQRVTSANACFCGCGPGLAFLPPDPGNPDLKHQRHVRADPRFETTGTGAAGYVPRAATRSAI
jgi:hypothetical protein